MTHCTSFFQMSSGRKAKFSTATTSSGTNGMLFFCQQLNTWDASYNTTAEIEITFIHNCQLETSVHFLKSNLSFLTLKQQIRIFESAYYDLVILHSTSTLLYIMFPMGRIWKFQQGLLRIRDLYDSLENHSSCCIQNGK